jgi:hypothetical protein
MLLLVVIEEHLGAIDSWSAYILEYLFADDLSPIRSDKLKEAIAFFYGNNVPCALACQMYHACKGKFLYL